MSVTKTLDGAMSGIRDLVDGVGYVAKTLEGMRVVLCVCVCVCVIEIDSFVRRKTRRLCCNAPHRRVY